MKTTPGEGCHKPDGMAHRVDGRVDVEVVEAHAAVRAAVDGEAAAEPVGLLVDGPVLLRAQVVREPARGEHGARHPQFLHRPPQFEGCLLGLLHGDEGEPDEPGAALDVGVVEPVVVGPAHGDGPVPVDDVSVGQPARREQRRAVDADLVHEHQPLFDTDLGERPRRRCDRLSGVEVVDRREDAAEVAAPRRGSGSPAACGLRPLRCPSPGVRLRQRPATGLPWRASSSRVWTWV